MMRSMVKFRRLKVIEHNVGRINHPDDPSFPYKLEADLSHPEGMELMAAIAYGGCEWLVVRAKSLRRLNRFIKKMDLRTHPRLLRLTVSGPDGEIEKLPVRNRA